MESVNLSVKLPERLQRRLHRRPSSNSRKPTKSPSRVKPAAQTSLEAEDEEAVHSEGSPDADENGLVWRPVPRSQIKSGLDDAAVLAFEEIEDVDVVYEEGPGGRKLAKLIPKRGRDDVTHSDPTSRTTKRRKVTQGSRISLDNDFDGDALLPEWSSIPLLPNLKKSLHEANFSVPTDIQRHSLPHALGGRDIVGVAETGSGKTLAFGLPIIQHILNTKLQSSTDLSTPREVQALILAPTRELALQVSDHLRKFTPVQPVLEDGKRPPPVISITSLVGGMSAQKQKRLLERGVDILIATPGRLWDILQENDRLANQLRGLRFLVLDEADRMIETGHFQELENILKLTLRPGIKDPEGTAVKDPEFAELERKAGLAQEDRVTNESLQTFVFSATLSKDLQQNLKRRSFGPRVMKGKEKPSSTLDDLLARLDFRDPEPEIIDLSPEGGAVSTLQESKIECTTADKDLYLYYFLLRYPGRSLVFVSSIDSIRRIVPLLETLQLPAYPLHSHLQQKQRLKNLDRFKTIPNAILVATDVAARGLDIPSIVDHVVHYQLPRTADMYVHRNGRTARAKREGFSLQLVGPDEKKVAKALLTSIGRAEDVPELAIEYDMLAKLRERVALAREIDIAAHRVQKSNHERNWLRETAEALDIEISDDDEMMGMDIGGVDSDGEVRQKKKKKKKSQLVNEDDEGGAGDAHRRNKQAAKLVSKRAEMKALLAQPLVARGISVRYLTSGSRSGVVDELLSATHHKAMLGLRNHGAQNDVVKGKKKALHKPKAPSHKTIQSA